MSSQRVKALRLALENASDKHPLRLLLAETLQKEGMYDEALQEYSILLSDSQLDSSSLVPVGELALERNDIELASRCLDEALAKGIRVGVARLRNSIDNKMAEQGYIRVVTPSAGVSNEIPVEGKFGETEAVSFAEVGGLHEAKEAIHRLIILPLLRPELYRKYRRKPGGGILLYGPPGCGKTLLARATAGECELPFTNVRIEEILDPHFGMSERNLHRVFERARGITPCILFLDELDALAYARKRRAFSVGRSLVDQVLQELDAIGSDNLELLILAATNEPWDIDDALLRPGRFDRRILVPPPNDDARERILRIMLSDLPVDDLDLKEVAGNTPLFSGADLRALVDIAVDSLIEEAIETAKEPPLTMGHLRSALQKIRPTTVDWLERAENYVEFANQDRRYDEVGSYLKSREVQQWKRRY